MHASRRLSRVFAVPASLLIVAGAGLLRLSPAVAVPATFDASATASGARITQWLENGALTSTPIDGGGPMAQAILSSLGTSTALAAQPFPGDFALAGPGTLAGATGTPALPDYPFAAVAEYPSRPEAQQSVGFAELVASAGVQASKATSSSGGAGQGFAVGRNQSTTSVAVDGDSVVATARTLVNAFEVGPLKIGSLVATSKVVLLPDGSLERSSAIKIENATVDGLPKEIGSALADDVDTPTAAPTAEEGPGDVLEGAGIKVEQLPKEDTQDGVVSAGLRITKEGQFGPFGRGTLTINLGQVSARVRASAVESAIVVPDVTSESQDGSAALTPEAGVSSPSPAIPSESAFAASTDFGLPAPAMTSHSSLPDVTAAAPWTAPEPDGAVTLQLPAQKQPLQAAWAARTADRFDLTPVFPLMAAAVMLGGTAVRFRRVLSSSAR